MGVDWLKYWAGCSGKGDGACSRTTELVCWPGRVGGLKFFRRDSRECWSIRVVEHLQIDALPYIVLPVSGQRSPVLRMFGRHYKVSGQIVHPRSSRVFLAVYVLLRQTTRESVKISGADELSRSISQLCR